MMPLNHPVNHIGIRTDVGMMAEFRGKNDSRDLQRAAIAFAAGIVALCVVFFTVVIVSSYERYVPPDFRQGFLFGRD